MNDKNTNNHEDLIEATEMRWFVIMSEMVEGGVWGLKQQEDKECHCPEETPPLLEAQLEKTSTLLENKATDLGE